MDLDEVLRCLVEADAGRLRPELCERSYVVLEYVDRWSECEDNGDIDWDDDFDPKAVEVSGAATSLYGAFDLLAEMIARPGEDPESMTADVREPGVEEREYEKWLGGWELRHVSSLRRIHTPGRRMLAYYLMGIASAPMNLITENFQSDYYLGGAATMFDGARFVFLISAAPPHQDEAYAILER
ncbi:hypothetical protein [Nocardia sp. NPDC052566]|uniref:hypothetical protein n=1 Tax=Nocardia sp. NPDC052566 TaxID=3364330 RepID=UPI0037CB86C6